MSWIQFDKNGKLKLRGSSSSTNMIEQVKEAMKNGEQHTFFLFYMKVQQEKWNNISSLYTWLFAYRWTSMFFCFYFGYSCLFERRHHTLFRQKEKTKKKTCLKSREGEEQRRRRKRKTQKKNKNKEERAKRRGCFLVFSFLTSLSVFLSILPHFDGFK